MIKSLPGVVFSGLVLAMMVPAAPAADYALLIGASDYERGGKSGLRNLKYPRNDVEDFSAVLVECGYKRRNIVLMYDGQADNSYVPEYSKIRAQFDLLLKDLNPEDSVIVALAGHGVQFAGEKVNYYCPLDADPQNGKNLISLSEVYNALHECQAARKMLLVDACRDDAVSVASRSGFAKMKLESVSRPQVEDVPEQTIAIFSCQRGQQSWEDSAVSHGIFFYHVIKGLRGAADAPVADGKITVPELAEYVKEETKSYAFSKLKKNQSPIVRNEGDTKWYFRKPSRAQAPPRPLAEANRLRIAGELEAAREAYDRAILAEPAEPKAYLGRGLVSLLMDDTAGALADFQQVVRLDPQNAAGWTSLGGAQGRDGKFADAVTSYTTALKITPAAVAPLAGRGAAQVELGQIGAGLRDLNRALKIEPDSIDALYNRARAHQKLGDLDSARRDLERAKALEASGR